LYNTITATSLNVDQSGGAMQLGTYVQVFFGAITTSPSGLPFTASPGAVFFRSHGSESSVYINTSDGISGSVWTQK
jgi:hypothetical protein